MHLENELLPLRRHELIRLTQLRRKAPSLSADPNATS